MRSERLVRMRGVPSRTHVREIARAGINRRDLRGVLARTPRQDRRLPVDACVAQPALRARDQAPGRASAERLCQHADHAARQLGQRRSKAQLRIRVGQLFERGLVTKRRQLRARRHLAGCDQLRHVEDGDPRRAQLCKRDDRVGRAEIDADDVLHAFSARVSSSTFQRVLVVLATASSCSVPTSVTPACSCTITTSPGL